jgi:hypothetical protein
MGEAWKLEPNLGRASWQYREVCREHGSEMPHPSRTTLWGSPIVFARLETSLGLIQDGNTPDQAVFPQTVLHLGAVPMFSWGTHQHVLRRQGLGPSP